MSCSCNTTKPGRVPCPGCHRQGRPVTMQTVLHQVRYPHNQQLATDHYAFCANADCDIGYFSPSATISKAQLRAFQPARQPMLCYCFDISRASYRRALSDGTAEKIKAFVMEQTKQGLCACTIRHPSGRCCLADFRSIEHAHDH